MSLIVDTSVWSLALRRRGPADHPAVGKLSRALEDRDDILLLGVILQEVLQGFRHPATAASVKRHFEPFPLLPLQRADFVAAARLHRACASRGIAASTVDCQIAAAAMRSHSALLTADADFAHIAKISPLKLA
jgi:hypothetical protein